MNTDEEIDLMKMFALGNLSMLSQIADGEITAREGEVTERVTWLVNYLKTGEGLVTVEGQEIAERVRAALLPVADAAAG